MNGPGAQDRTDADRNGARPNGVGERRRLPLTAAGGRDEVHDADVGAEPDRRLGEDEDRGRDEDDAGCTLVQAV